MNENIKPICINLYKNNGKEREFQDRIYKANQISTALTTSFRPYFIIKEIVAMRGRPIQNPKSRKAGLPTKQILEKAPDGISNTLTTVQKDNMIMETLRIKQATEEGFIEMEAGGLADLSYPDSKTRRGRVQENGTVSPTLTAANTGVCKIESVYRIRKLTPLECFRLMGVTDEDAKKMLAVNSNSQCYKQAGNSIVVDVMVAMFKKLF